MRLIGLSLFLIVFPFVLNAQIGSMKKKDSNAKGTLWGYWGYNRSGYTRSNIRFVGPGYDFTMKDAVAYDHPEKFDPSIHLNPANMTITQYNARIGYYFNESWSISLGYDHMKYFFADNNQVYLNGEIDPGVDTSTNWSGVFNEEPVITHKDKFNYENSDGLNYIRLELTRTDQWFKLGGKNQFVLSTNFGLSAGTVLSSNDFLFAGRRNMSTMSLSGYGLSLHVGPRFEFFRHVFIQSNLGAGFMHQVKVRTRPNDPSSYARQAFGFLEFDTVVGFLIYLKPKNTCDTCPEW